jgi:NADH-quinone oxidoreductase subunit E
MTNPAHIAETALLFLAAYLLGCILGYVSRLVLHAGRGTRQVPAPPPEVVAPPLQPRRSRSPAARLAARVDDLPDLPPPAIQPVPPAAIPALADAPVPPPRPRAKPARRAKAPDPKPASLAAPRDGQPDNLKQIKGIGPKIEASLHGMGIFHIDQIAAWSKANVDWVDAQLAFKGRIGRERWVEQAIALSTAKADA